MTTLRSPHPWAIIADHPCVTAKCADCNTPYGDVDDGGTWHFDSADDLVKSITDSYQDDDEDDRPWQIVGEVLVCRSCAAARVCAVKGHRWKREPAYTSATGRTIPGYWRCLRYCSGSMRKSDPTKGGGAR